MKISKINVKGFTLTELVIVISIVIILSMISIPVYYGHVKNAIWDEAYAFFAQIRDAQLLYRSEYGCFLNGYNGYSEGGTTYNPVLGINGKLNKYFTAFSVGWPANQNSFRAYLQKPAELGGGRVFYSYNLTSGIDIG
ncbi:MAG: prepilin-type N-terminal cleavage/methylation domain-containing protein [Elusimicrobia bacterium]|nr:prepilin-type N-terminal cleavage/methylation domain-containing protein [Elusimicrobiota bacterium]